MENEFAKYSITELERKKTSFKKRQLFIMIFCGISVLILSIVAIINKNNEMYQLIPFLLISGVALPYIVFNPIRKKIQQQIDTKMSKE
jgi:uncharacterized membrane protein